VIPELTTDSSSLDKETFKYYKDASEELPDYSEDDMNYPY
jgi:hypothetical protein